ncbi:unnamed protein product [Knipowitschia caucasica]
MSTELNLLTLSENDVPGAKFTGIEVEEHTNIQLKRWLECRGLKKTGKRADLIQRCKDCIASGKAGDIDVSVDKGKWYQKLADTHTESPQTALESNDWKEFLPSNIPPLYNYGYVYHWLVESLPTLPTRPSQTEDSDEEDGHNFSCH